MRTQKHSSFFIVTAHAAALFFILAPALGAFSLEGGEYTLEASVIDSGGGERVEGGEYASKGVIASVSLPENIGLLTGGDYVSRAGFYNPPHFTYQRGLAAVMATQSGDLRMTLPPYAVGKERFDITINRDPVSTPMAVDPGKIDEANDKMVHNDGTWSRVLPGNMAEMSIFDEESYYEQPLEEKGVMTMRYRDADNDGILDGSNPPVRVETLNAWSLDQTRNMWVRLPGAGTYPGENSLSVYFGIPGVYAMLGAVADSVRDVIAFPVPFRPNGPNAGIGSGQTGLDGSCALCGITFSNVPQTGSIEIYTLDGRLVRKMSIAESLSPNQQEVKWDVRTAGGAKAASGVYIWRVVSGSGSGSKAGKLMVIW